MTEDDVIRASLGLARQAARRFARSRPVNWEDAYADALVGLLKAVRTHCPTGGSSFKNWAFHYMRSAMLDGLRNRNASRRRHNASAPVSLEHTLDRRGKPLRDVVPDRRPVPCASEVREALNYLLVTCSRRAQDLLIKRYVEGKSMLMIAGELDISESRVSQALKEVLDELHERVRNNPRFQEACL